jgi:hypothetical protein
MCLVVDWNVVLPLKAQIPLNPKKFAPTRVKPGTCGATEALVTTRL